VLADSGIHASNDGDTRLGLERADEALRLAEQIGNPAGVSVAQLAHGVGTRAEDPAQSIEWFRKASVLADTIESKWTSATCRAELSLMLALHGDPDEAVELGLTQLLAFRRAGDAARVRGSIRLALPAFHRLVEPSLLVQLVVLDAGTANRPYVKRQFNEQAISAVVAQIADVVGQEAVDQAASRGARMPDQEVFELALRMLEAAAGDATQLPAPSR
jgi:hypothetical protein